MTTAALTQIQRLADQLTPLEQAQLVQYLTPRLVQALVSMPPKPNSQRGAMPPEWQTLFAVGDTLPHTNHETSLTQTVLDMRR
jgi:hypothetical protein